MHRQVLQLGLVAALAACETAASAPPFTVEAEVHSRVPVGAVGTLMTRVTAGPGYHINNEFPINFVPDASNPSVTFTEERFDLRKTVERHACATVANADCEARAPVPFAVGAAGQHQVAGTLAFSVCNADHCLIEKAVLSAKVEATAPEDALPAVVD